MRQQTYCKCFSGHGLPHIPLSLEYADICCTHTQIKFLNIHKELQFPCDKTTNNQCGCFWVFKYYEVCLLLRMRELTRMKGNKIYKVQRCSKMHVGEKRENRAIIICYVLAWIFWYERADMHNIFEMKNQSLASFVIFYNQIVTKFFTE